MGTPDGRISASKVSDDNLPEEASKDSSTKNEPVPGSSPIVLNSPENEQNSSSENPYSEERLLNSFILLCCVDSLRLYSTKSVIQVPLAFFIFVCYFIVANMLMHCGLVRETINPFEK